MELELRIAQRIDQLTKERDKYIIEANRALSAYNTAIEELERLLKPEPQENTDA